MVTNEQQPLCHVSPGRERVGQGIEGTGFEEFVEKDTMSEESFASAESQGYRTEEEETLTFEVSMIQLGWQNEELVSDRWVKIADQPEVRVMQLTKRDEPPGKGRMKGARGLVTVGQRRRRCTASLDYR